MTKQRREVWMAIEEAQSALAIITCVGQDAALLEKARAALDKAQNHLSESLRGAREALDAI